MVPPPSPPSGPKSIIWSATFITSRLCSITITVSLLSTIFCKIASKRLISSVCRPVVGSSSTNRVLPVAFFCNSLANFTLSASPPHRVGALCPNLIFPKPTSSSNFSLFFIFGTFSKNFNASDTLISNTSAIFLSLYFIFNVSILYLVP